MSEVCFVAAFQGLHPTSACTSVGLKRTGLPASEHDFVYCGAPTTDDWYCIWDDRLSGGLHIRQGWAKVSEGCRVVTLAIDGRVGFSSAEEYLDGKCVWSASRSDVVEGGDEDDEGFPVIKGTAPPGEPELRAETNLEKFEEDDPADGFNYVIGLAELCVPTADGSRDSCFWQPSMEFAEFLMPRPSGE